MARLGIVGARVGGPFALLIRRQTRLSRGVKGILVTGITVTTILTSVATASAQNIFEALFGRLWNSPVTSYADPNAPLRNSEATRSEGGLAYCVRLCDGRYFPIQRHSGATSAQTCSSMCPASATKIYNGNAIDHAVAPDGKRYSELATAFAYRKKIIPGCTCNGRDAFGLVTTPVADDPTLRPGDIVTTNAGLMAYKAGSFDLLRFASRRLPRACLNRGSKSNYTGGISAKTAHDPQHSRHCGRRHSELRAKSSYDSFCSRLC